MLFNRVEIKENGDLMGDFLGRVSLYIVMFLMIIMVFLMFYYFLKGHIVSRVALFETIVGDRAILIVDKTGRIVRFSDAFEAVFPLVRKQRNFISFINSQNGLNDYNHENEFVTRVDGVSYLGRRELRDDLTYIELVPIVDTFRQGPIAIRKLLSDFVSNPIALEVDLMGRIVSSDSRLSLYWWLFKQVPIVHLSDLGIDQNDVEKFINQVENLAYVNGSLSIKYDGIDIFSVSANLSNQNTVLIYLSLVGEEMYPTTALTSTMRLMLDYLDDGLVTVNNFGRILFSNHKFLQMVNRTNIDRLFIGDVLDLYDDKGLKYTLDFPLKKQVHSYMWLDNPVMEDKLVVEMVVNEIREGDGFRVGYLFSFRDTSVREKREQEVRSFAFTDAQTGVYNRHYLKELITHLEVNLVDNFGIVIIDLNGLKVINDSFGHEAGDLAIQKTASVLVQCSKEQDHIIRIGGDEFLALLTDVDEYKIQNYIDNINQSIVFQDVGNIPLSLSVGSAYHADGMINFKELLEEAELKMYHHKTVSSQETRRMIMDSIYATLIDRNPWEGVHAEAVSLMNEKIASALGLGEETVAMIAEAGKYHNIGKVVLNEDVHRAGDTSEKHSDQFNKHNEAAFRILSAMPEYSYLATAVLHYKENWDGSGIPQGLEGENIPLPSRILRLSSMFHKLINPAWDDRRPCTLEEAVSVIDSKVGTELDPNLVKVLKEILEK